MINDRRNIRNSKLALLLAVFFAVFGVSSSCADDFQLPSKLKTVEAMAYANCESLFSVSIPTGVTAIGNGAFSGCSNLTTITIPASVQTLGTDCLSSCAEALLVQCSPDSAAHAYALAHGLDYNANTTYRALLIGQTYAGTSNELNGPANDAKALQHCATSFGITHFSATVKTDLTANGIFSTITDAFGSASDNDVSLFFYSGHGAYSQNADSLGALVGADGSLVTADALRSHLDTIKGRKIVIVDACHSGALIGKGASLADNQTALSSDAQAFTAHFPDAFASAFSVKARGNLASGGYYVITAAHSTQSSVEGTISSNGHQKTMGIFAFYLAKGCGWDGVADVPCALYADRNGDGVISLQEAYVYARDQASSRNASQTAQVYPSSCNSFGLFR